MEGIDTVMPDAYTAGRVHAWIRDGGVLAPERGRIPRTCMEDLNRVTPRISDPSGRHCYRVYSQCTGLQPGGEANL
ncbi:hypothetical protein ACFQ9Z_37400 [Streptomyces sp. NPDC056580]|uniref:hypothetical protein n=1 Tax=Streptomyces sp. NPDC056580 TaxID=3345872 RepID=UPI00368B90E7